MYRLYVCTCISVSSFNIKIIYTFSRFSLRYQKKKSQNIFTKKTKMQFYCLNFSKKNGVHPPKQSPRLNIWD